MHQLYQHYAQQYTMMYKQCQCYAQLLWYNWPGLAGVPLALMAMLLERDSRE